MTQRAPYCHIDEPVTYIFRGVINYAPRLYVQPVTVGRLFSGVGRLGALADFSKRPTQQSTWNLFISPGQPLLYLVTPVIIYRKN